MQKNTSITLTEHFEKFIASQIESGQYASASETIRAGLRLLEERNTKLQALRDAITMGEQSGMAKDFSFERLNKELDAEFDRKQT